jgi:hypothetical protein
VSGLVILQNIDGSLVRAFRRRDIWVCMICLLHANESSWPLTTPTRVFPYTIPNIVSVTVCACVVRRWTYGGDVIICGTIWRNWNKPLFSRDEKVYD